MQVDDGANFGHILLGAVEVVVDGQEVAGRQLVGPLDRDRLTGAGFDGGTGPRRAIRPDASGREIAMDLDPQFSHRDTVERRGLSGDVFRSDGLGDGWDRERISELGERVRTKGRRRGLSATTARNGKNSLRLKCIRLNGVVRRRSSRWSRDSAGRAIWALTTEPVDSSRTTEPEGVLVKSSICTIELAMASKEPPPMRVPPSQLSSMKRRMEDWSVTV